ncbi:PTS N-acetylglucosamine transporter subunit IIABC [Vagococcus penaei]|uniref:PTS N-acetylglucosamine transporter subunit IIABC n=1 Tax=Vagococcus penaei TaxID=633807 RepID=A0A1Q2D4B9_9ENTE|nr:PTS glucose transporter subunit IIA [Vagococcus penaei]AQP53228.1 PTS N-acetylglucosamine transporter subunit IIABC [Vagococcus penaei]RST98673.1 PTS N-acetylglucosamine transporter subunit IIABC [Vagococcus penaei]
MFNFFKKNKKESATEPEVVVDNQVYAVAKGKLIAITDVKDPVFSEKMMGDGYAVVPTEGAVYSPVTGEILNVFPTKHAIGIKMDSGIEVLLHMGINTVELDGKPFDVHVKEGDRVTGDTLLATVDLEALATAEKDNDLIVIFTSGNEELTVNTLGPVEPSQAVGQATLKA